jgi:hypothetical protein
MHDSCSAVAKVAYSNPDSGWKLFVDGQHGVLPPKPKEKTKYCKVTAAMENKVDLLLARGEGPKAIREQLLHDRGQCEDGVPTLKWIEHR